MGTSALAFSIFLVARCRAGKDTGANETVVISKLDSSVREHTKTLWARASPVPI